MGAQSVANIYKNIFAIDDKGGLQRSTVATL